MFNNAATVGQSPTATPRHYSFEDKLAKSQLYKERLELILKARLPFLVNLEQASHKADLRGTDYWAYDPTTDRRISIDLKQREEDWSDKSPDCDDLALETWSVLDQKIGWTRDISKRTDYVVWYWADTGRYFVVPFPALCRIMRARWEGWYKEYRHAIQTSGGWQSECIFVPRKVVEAELQQWMNGRIKI